MTEEQQRIAIAKACGYTEDERNTGKHGTKEKGWWMRGRFYVGDNCLPQYLHDLNAMHEAEVVIIKSGYTAIRTYEDLLQKQIANIIFATAAQRAEAFLRALNLWKK